MPNFLFDEKKGIFRYDGGQFNVRRQDGGKPVIKNILQNSIKRNVSLSCEYAMHDVMINILEHHGFSHKFKPQKIWYGKEICHLENTLVDLKMHDGLGVSFSGVTRYPDKDELSKLLKDIDSLKEENILFNQELQKTYLKLGIVPCEKYEKYAEGSIGIFIEDKKIVIPFDYSGPKVLMRVPDEYLSKVYSGILFVGSKYKDASKFPDEIFHDYVDFKERDACIKKIYENLNL